MMKKTVFLLFIVLLTSCNSYKKIAYLQQAGTQAVLSDTTRAVVPDPVIKVGDVLMITVNTNTPEAAIPFNLPLIPSGESSRTYSGGNGSYLSYGLSMQNYLVDMEGNLVFPVIGKIKVAGMTKSALAEQIKKTIYPRYITEEPIILIRYANFKVSVLGEVVHPGSFIIDNEKLSVLEALALAGDMTIYGRRESILLIRENNGNRETVRLDIRNKNLVNSPYFYLQQNDVIYVEPNDSRARASAISTAESLSISIVGTLISLTTLIINILK
ncbi:MAG: polysaccharide biosynthesis/export family protein [Paludibacter sp.]|nr:polysaccharide biosynthesis/export family protein [Paludibacter sp.]MDD4199170.1 polysaccharide biosynthesis/export family protein [Paludibacter sp.]MDD4428562.1 polysaccharide biosynthesis/export family protein [Paludibacter sp.]